MTKKCYQLLELKLNAGKKKISKFHTNHTQLYKMFKLWHVGQFIVLNLYFYKEKRKGYKRTY